MSAESFGHNLDNGFDAGPYEAPVAYGDLSEQDAAKASSKFFRGIRDLRQRHDPDRQMPAICIYKETPTEPIEITLTNDSLLLSRGMLSGRCDAYIPDGVGKIHAFTFQKEGYTCTEDIVDQLTPLRDETLPLDANQPQEAEITGLFDWINGRP